ncbi:MAG: helix-turn-helix transcriptional regulator [Janthinobacterium lividum]
MQPDTHLSSPLVADAADFDVVLTYAETARMLRLSTRTLDRMCEIGEAPPRIRLASRRIGFWRRDVLAWLQSRTAPTKRCA